ncbi:MAG: DUF1801 domain-containing protein [Burkholderiaceae bacterium]|nr:DUF1801 domain-containing protein [Burkholderiaceae bacterium]
MAEPKTKPTRASVADYLDALPDARVRADCRTLVALMSRASCPQPVMWGTSIVGFGAYHYTYASGTTGDWPLTGFAPRAKDITVYLMDGFEQRAAQLKKLGPRKHSSSCLYLKSLQGVDLHTLESMVVDSIRVMRARWPAGTASAARASPQAPAANKAVKSAVKKTPPARKATPAQKGSAKTARKSVARSAAKPATPAKSAAKPRARR